ncbi:MAG: hypothetical protein PHC88_04955 [Terrimicrobiaceae bacterium]|nr:hypothetical protein [Terrimicrobiaceae bacterium]
MGVDILNSVQTTAAGMDARRLKDEFGGRLVFWGGSGDCQNTLTFSTPEAVAKEARANLEIFAPGGGFVFGPSTISRSMSPRITSSPCSIQPSASTRNP